MINAIVNELDETLAALADPTRRLVVDLLRVRPRAAGELAAGSGTSRPAMSRHLRTLRLTGLIEQDPADGDGRIRRYRLRRDRFAALQAWLDQVEAFWTEQLGAFKAHAERTRGGSGT